MRPSAGRAEVSTAEILHLDTVSSWLRKHGKPVRPRLDRRQLEALRECFDIIDTDGTGTITVEELRDVFKVAPYNMSRQAAKHGNELLPHQLLKSHAVTTNTAYAMQSLGDHVSLSAVATVLDSVRYHGSNGIGFSDFIDIMSRDSQDLREGGHNRSNGNATTAYNIALMARAYR